MIKPAQTGRAGRPSTIARMIATDNRIINRMVSRRDAEAEPEGMGLTRDQIAALITNPDCGLYLLERGAFKHSAAAEYWTENLRKADAILKAQAEKGARTNGSF